MVRDRGWGVEVPLLPGSLLCQGSHLEIALSRDSVLCGATARSALQGHLRQRSLSGRQQLRSKASLCKRTGG